MRKVLFYNSAEYGLEYYYNSKHDYRRFETRFPSNFNGRTVDGYHILDADKLPNVFDVKKDFVVITDGYAGYHSLYTDEYRSTYLGYNMFVVPSTIEPLKRLAYNAVDQKTGLQFEQGFEFAGMTFSLSQNAQIKWSGLYNSRHMQAYPLIASNIDDSDGYIINSAAEVEAIYQTAVNKVRELLDNGRIIKEEIRAYTSKQQLKNYADTHLSSLAKLKFDKAIKEK